MKPVSLRFVELLGSMRFAIGLLTLIAGSFERGGINSRVALF